MDARIPTSLGERSAIVQRERTLLKRIRELEGQLLRGAAVAMVAAIWAIVPIAGLSGMYYMSGSAIAPLCLAGVIALIAAVNYALLSWMLVASADLRRLAIVTDVTQRPQVARRAASEDLEQAAEEPHKTAA
jgi:hypothetical protein